MTAWVAARNGCLCAALVATLAVGEAKAQAIAASQAATRQYTVAAALQNRGEYESAATQWRAFLADNASDRRSSLARHYLGICLLQLKEYAPAVAEFDAVAALKPPAEVAEANAFFGALAEYYRAQGAKARDYEAAIQRFRDAAATFPNGEYGAETLFYLAEAEYALDQKAEAATHYAALLKRFPDDKLAAEALYALAVAEAELDRHEQAEQSFTRFLTRFPVHRLAAEVHLRRGEELLAMGQAEQATLAFQAAAATTGFKLADLASLREAIAFEQLGQFAGAARLFASMDQRYPGSELLDEARLGAGRAWFRSNDLPKAIDALAPLAGAKGETPREAAHYLAQSYLKADRAADALASVEPALAETEESFMAPQLAMDRADALLALEGRAADALAAYLEVVERFPNDPLAAQGAYLAAYAAALGGDHARAVELGEAFLAAPPRADLTADCMYLVAESLLKLGRHADAAELYGQLVADHRQRPERDAWRVRRGLSLVLAKDWKRAEGALADAAEKVIDAELRAEALYLLASVHTEKGDTARAAETFAACVAADPSWRRCDEALVALAAAESKLERTDRARAALERLLRDYPTSALADRALLRLGELATAAGDKAAAKEFFERLTREHPDSDLAANADDGRAWLMLDDGEAAAARDLLRRRLEGKYPDELGARLRYALAMAHYQLKEFGPARDELDQLLNSKKSEDFDERSAARYLLALCEVQLKEPRRAVEPLLAILRDDADYASTDKVLYELAWAYRDSGEAAESAKTFERLANEFPDSRLVAESLYRVGESAAVAKEYAAAAAAFAKAERAAAAADNDVLAFRAAYERGRSLYRGESFAEAAEVFADLREDNGGGDSSEDARFMEAEARFKAGDHERALAVYSQADFANAEFQAAARLHAGQAAAKLNRFGQSMEILDRAAKEQADSPYLPEILYELAWARQQLGETDQALSLYERVTEKTEREVAARARFMIGELYFLKKDYAAAITHFFTVAYAYGYPVWQADAHFEAARCFELLGKTDQARQSYRAVVDEFPTSDKREAAERRLAALEAEENRAAAADQP